MIKMFAENRIIVAPELKVKDLQAKGWELDRIIEYAVEKGFDAADIVYSANDFIPKTRIITDFDTGEEKEVTEDLLTMLQADRKRLSELKSKWEEITEDPKLDLFVEKLQTELFDSQKNPTGKLVVFSESVDTLNYLKEHLIEKLQRNDILEVTSSNRTREFDVIRQCFDANLSSPVGDDAGGEMYNILLTSDVLAEGVNLHRANVIVNYDSPWNATRLMQRIGRVNRIGSLAGEIYNYMFYPSAEGDAQIQLYNNALIKLQGFHSALGEDAQIYSREEIVREFQLFNPKVKDKVDKQLELLREVRELYNTDRSLYKKIKALPMKSRVARHCSANLISAKSTIAFISSPRKTEYYVVSPQNAVKSIDFIDAAFILKAKREEAAAPFAEVESVHYEQVNSALQEFRSASIRQQDTGSLNEIVKDRGTAEAQSFLRNYALVTEDDDIRTRCNLLREYVQQGIYAQLAKTIRAISREIKNDRQTMRDKQYEIDIRINELYDRYYTAVSTESAIDNTDPNIVISETFV
jgi:superfamily II DNA/RNA helicase